MDSRPAQLAHIKVGGPVGVDNFAATFNWLVSCIENLRVNGGTVEGLKDGRIIIKLNASASVEMVSAEDSNVVITDEEYTDADADGNVVTGTRKIIGVYWL